MHCKCWIPPIVTQLQNESSDVGAGGGGCKRTPKSFDLSEHWQNLIKYGQNVSTFLDNTNEIKFLFC